MWAPSSSRGRAMAPSVARAALTPRCPDDIMPRNHRPGAGRRSAWSRARSRRRSPRCSRSTTAWPRPTCGGSTRTRSGTSGTPRATFPGPLHHRPTVGRSPTSSSTSTGARSGTGCRRPSASSSTGESPHGVSRPSCTGSRALLATSQPVDIVKGADAKFFQATQVMDEARHNEVLDRYITERLDNRKYPIPANARDVFDSILGESRWYVKTIGLQLVAETFAVALFKMMAESARDPVLEAVCRRILQDESRHMGFGMLALPEVVDGASPGERRELEDYTCFAVEKTLTGFFPREAYEDAGFSRAEIEEAKRYRRDVAARNDYAPFRKLFKRDMHASMVANLARLGLLTERVRPKLAKLGVTLPAN